MEIIAENICAFCDGIIRLPNANGLLQVSPDLNEQVYGRIPAACGSELFAALPKRRLTLCLRAQSPAQNENKKFLRTNLYGSSTGKSNCTSLR